MRTAYSVRAHPDPEQAVMPSRTFGWVRAVWNRRFAAQHAALVGVAVYLAGRARMSAPPER